MNKIKNKYNLQRKSGILLHPTSLPGKHGIGDLGKEAFEFIDFLENSGQTLWQVLPLGPTGYGDSPYASFSTHGGNPFIISPELLIEQGYLNKTDLDDEPVFDESKIDFGKLIPWKKNLLNKAAIAFQKRSGNDRDFKHFCREEAHWLDEWLADKYGDQYLEENGYFTSTTQLERATRSYYHRFHVMALRKTPISILISELRRGRPIIVAVRLNMSSNPAILGHFMVLTGISNNHVWVNDVGRSAGKYLKFTREQFEASWDTQNRAAVIFMNYSEM